MTDDTTQDYRGRHVASPLHGLKLGLAALVLSLALPSAFLNLYLIDAANPGVENDVSWMLGWILFGYFAIPAALVVGVLAIRKNRALGKIAGVVALLIATLIIAYHVISVVVMEGYLKI